MDSKSKRKPDWAERVARRLVTLQKGNPGFYALKIAGWELDSMNDYKSPSAAEAEREYVVADLAAALRKAKAGVKVKD